MKPVFPPNTPEGIAFTPAFTLAPGSTIAFLGLITPERSDGTISPSITQQSRDCLSNLHTALQAIHPDATVFKITRLMTDAREWLGVQEQVAHFFEGNGPTSTLLEVPFCSTEGARIEFEVWAVVEEDSGRPVNGAVAGPGGFPLARTTEKGQSLRMIGGTAGDAAGKGVVSELSACLDAVDAQVAAGKLAKLTLYIADARALQKCRELLCRRYGEDCPVLVPIAVNKVQQTTATVEVMATITTDDEGERGNRLGLFPVAGAAAIPMYGGGKAKDAYNYVPERTASSQAKVAFGNCETILRSAGGTWSDVFKTTWYLSDIREWPEVEKVAKETFGGEVPNPTIVEIPKLVLASVRVEVDIWGWL